MNNKGFTLIELIATIALLAIIAVVSFVSINEVLKQSKISDCENLINSIKSATKEYVSDNRYGDINRNLSIEDLVAAKYLSTPVNPFDNRNSLSANIEITLTNKYNVDTIVIRNLSGNEVDCRLGKW